MTDADGFEPWYAEAYPRLVTALALVAGDRDEAEEAAAEAITRCLERWGTPQQPRDPSAWTYTVGLNLLRRRWRRRRREADHLASLPPIRPVETDAPALELWRAVAALPRGERTAVVLRYVGGLGEKEVAEAMDVTEGTVASSLSRARRKLGPQLRALGFDPTLEAERADG
ncbi:MAG: sigma-70 family RNA polymerase sigma factor [Acidimicrobiales bacterium]|nr:sigma-70 family RNA polymerase sigma factor [Acidimicrobiales bacterium]HRW36140.1 sigma-70 family RNA polymerase sigma factor [Aquihabitans sp.]